jgi:hypothetical protein
LRRFFISDLPENVSNRNLKHIKKHLPEFQKYDPNFTLNDLIKLGQAISQNSLNFISTSGGRQIFEKTVKMEEHYIKVRVVLNPLGNIRSIHIRY